MSILLLVYKALNGLGPKYIIHLLQNYKLSRLLRSSGTGLLSVPKTTAKHGEAAFSFYVPHVWNKLPKNCVSAETLNYFKSRLRTFMFAAAFYYIIIISCIVTFILKYHIFYSVLAVIFSHFIFSWFLMTCFNNVSLNVILLHVYFVLLYLM